MGNKIYSPAQIELIQDELKNAFNIAKKEENLSWERLARDIEEYFSDLLDRSEIPLQFRKITTIDFLNYDNLRLFAIGKSKSMDDIKMIAVSYWLMSDDNCWSSFTNEKLLGKSPAPKIALLFSDFLHKNSNEKPFVSADMLQGEFLLQKENLNINLSVHSKKTDYVLSVSITEQRNINNEYISFGACLEIQYSGWIVIAPNDGIFCILENLTDKCNHIYIPLALDEESVLDKKPISHITFLNLSGIDYTNFSNSNIHEAGFLNHWASNNSSNIIIFQRGDN